MLARRKLQKDTSDLLKRLLPASVIPSLLSLYTQQARLDSAMKVIYSRSRDTKEARKLERLGSKAEYSTTESVVPLTADALEAHRKNSMSVQQPSLLSFSPPSSTRQSLVPVPGNKKGSVSQMSSDPSDGAAPVDTVGFKPIAFDRNGGPSNPPSNSVARDSITSDPTGPVVALASDDTPLIPLAGPPSNRRGSANTPADLKSKPVHAAHTRSGSAPLSNGASTDSLKSAAGAPSPKQPVRRGRSDVSGSEDELPTSPRRESQISTLSQSSAAPILSGKLPTIAHVYTSVTVLQADICDFTPLCSALSATDVVWLLNDLFFIFDQLTDHHGVYKVETIGDAYLAVAGAPMPSRRHAQQCAELALDMQKAVQKFRPRTIPKMFQLDADNRTVNRTQRRQGKGDTATAATRSNFRDMVQSSSGVELAAVASSTSTEPLVGVTVEPSASTGSINAGGTLSDPDSKQRRPPTQLRMRIGVHSGNVVGGVVGITNMPRYHLFGETVLCVEKLETHTPPGSILVSDATASCLQPLPPHYTLTPAVPLLFMGKQVDTFALSLT
jgi:class 3 adenylate cyclase